MSTNPVNTNFPGDSQTQLDKFVERFRSRGGLERIGADAVLAVPHEPRIVTLPEPRIEVPTIIIPSGGGAGTASRDASRDWGEFDFISEYTAWADVIELPKEVHTAAAIQLVASVLNANGVVIPHSDFVYPMDLWQLVLTPSGGGRSAMLRGVKRLLRAADLRHLLRSSDWASVPAMEQHFAENPYSLLFWSEFSEHLDFFNNQGGKRWFTDRYDDTEPPDDRTYRKTGSDQDRPAIHFERAPRINIFAASSDGWFFQDMETNDSTGGFLPRWMLVRTGDMEDVPTPPPLDEGKQAELIERLKAIAIIQGRADISQILPTYNDWYTPTRKRFEEASPSLGRIYFSRHRGIVFKLAVVYEVSRSGSLRVTRDSWNAAAHTGRELERTLFELLDTGMNQRGWEITEVAEFIRSGGPDGIARWKVSRAFRGVDDLQKHIQTLITDRIICSQTVHTGGAPGVVYIHQDHLAEGGG